MSEAFEVKGTLNVTTSGEWTGLITVDRSADGGTTWITVRQYRRTDEETQGQWDFTISETEDNVLYRVKAQHDKPSGTSVSTADVSASGSSRPLPEEYNAHPNVEGGENYIYWEKWGWNISDWWTVKDKDGKDIDYDPQRNQTFYHIGTVKNLSVGDYTFDVDYGYVVNGVPEGYKFENWNLVPIAESSGE